MRRTGAEGPSAARPLTHGERACCTQLTDLAVRLGSFTALERVNLHVHCGELTAIVGANGSGKTTLLRAIMGEVAHTGHLSYVASAAEGRPGRPRIGYVPQRVEIDRTAPLTVLDLFASARTRWPIWLGYPSRVRSEAREALGRVGVEELLEKGLGHLSCGQLQRVLLAVALTPVPELLLLDEPLAGMDRAGTAQFYEIVSSLRRDMDLSILLVSHDLPAVVAIADRMIFLHGRTILCEGAPADVLQQPVVRETFGLDLPLPSDLSEVPAPAPRCPLSPGREAP